jgi:hypothetical protein
VLIGIAGWIALAALWVWQLGAHVPANWFNGVELILAMLAGWVCLSGAWVAWNRSISRRRHRRTSPIEREVDFAHDTLGRPIVLAPAVRTARGQVLVSVDASGIKRYRLATQEAPERTQPLGAGRPVVAARRRRRLPV